ncbi:MULTISPECIES: hypothetical protein [unclassified Mycobacterium]|uniref:hypothetical protein n=1 Tax=unclassified Mycobacterium TaxID=2642494 RepID=UPI0029C7DBA0|nr:MULTISPECIES: hypothetical protein [unclassified Mycobacterium]
MSDDDYDRALENFLDHKMRQDREAIIANWSENDRAEFLSLIDIADLIWEAGHEAPALDADPIAAMLGLIPDPQVSLDSRALSRARKRARLKPSDIAERLMAHGWNVGVRDVFRWEVQSAMDVSPALIRAIADVIGAKSEQLIADQRTPEELHATLSISQSPRFESLVSRWSRLQGMSHALASSALQSRMLATVHRGDRPNEEQMLRSLDALITALEEGQHPKNGS